MERMSSRARESRSPALATAGRMLAASIAAAAISVSMSGPVLAQAASNDARVQQFVTALQQASMREDRTALAGMMRFPLAVMSSGFRLPVGDARAFGELFGQIFTPETKAIIQRARVPRDGTISPTVAVGPAGGAVIEGAIVIEPVGDGLRITQITVPPAAPSRGGTASAGAAQRLSFRAGRPTQVNGAIDPGGRDLYELSAGQGTLLDVRLDGVKGNTVLVRVIDAAGAPLDARADRGARVWTGRVPATASYRIEVVRQPGSGAGTLLYTLAVALK